MDPEGNVRWRSDEQPYLDDFNLFRPYFSDDGWMYMLTEAGLHAVNTNSGHSMKSNRLIDLVDIRSSGIPTDGQGGYYIEISGNIHKINAQGKSLWTYVPRETEKYGVGSLDPMETDNDGNVYFPTGVGNIIGLNSAGQEMFVFLRNAFWHKMTDIVVGPSGNIYSANDDIGLVAFGSRSVQVYKDNLYMPMSVAPINDNGTVIVPFRSLFESFGLEIDWDPASRKVTGLAQDMQITLTIGSTTAYVNGEQRTLSQAPRIENGSTFIPLRFVGEALGKTVSWNGTSSFVNIDSL